MCVCMCLVCACVYVCMCVMGCGHVKGPDGGVQMVNYILFIPCIHHLPVDRIIGLAGLLVEIVLFSLIV